MGIIGFGRIGRATARIAQALGMKALAFDTSRKAAPEREVCQDTRGGAITNAPAGELHPAGYIQEQTVMYTDLETLLANSDVISLHCPLFPSTQGMDAAVDNLRAFLDGRAQNIVNSI